MNYELWQAFMSLPFELEELLALLTGLAAGTLVVLLMCGTGALRENWRDRHRR